VKDQLQELKTEKAVIDNELTACREEKDKQSGQIENKDRELEKWRTDFTKADTEREGLILDIIEKNLEINKLNQKIEVDILALQAASNKANRLEAELVFKEKELQETAKSLEDIGKKFEKEFSNLAQKILDEKSKTFGSQQETNLKLLLEPFKNDIVNFKREFTDKHGLESAERNTLKGVIQEMVSNNKILSEQANNLTRALTFQSKQQGDWGEEILEGILEHCGLQINVHYFRQYSSKNEQGDRIQPDFVVNCPDNRCVIIDSKVSLNHFTSYCSTNVKLEQDAFLKSMMLSIKTHIDGLSSKKYSDIANTIDEVFMFMPNEGAFILAMQSDKNLWRYAYNKGLILISPSSLITTIKLISNLWQRDAINKNARLIAEKAGRLYDKLVGFVDNMKRVGDCIGKANETWQVAYGQLYTGHGNLVNQAEAIKNLGAKSGNKRFPDAIINEALSNDPLLTTNINDEQTPA
jgi:DNA recombination protein RmuC